MHAKTLTYQELSYASQEAFGDWFEAMKSNAKHWQMTAEEILLTIERFRDTPHAFEEEQC